MAIARLSVKVGKVGKAQPHAAYISRTGKYEKRLETGEKLEATGTGNMPDWASADPLLFWQAADIYERKNGSTYREHEIALPRELSSEQRLALVNDWIRNEVGNDHAYQFAIHTPTASDGREQPHCHLMFCERRNDGIARDPDQYFKRYNKKNPERGGAQKTNTGIKPAERKKQLTAQRERWQTLCNDHLKQAGHDMQIDMRSYADQGKEVTPEPKILPSEWRDSEQKNNIIQFREARKNQARAKAEINQQVPNPEHQIIQLKEAEEHRKQLQPETIKKLFDQEWHEHFDNKKAKINELEQDEQYWKKSLAEHMEKQPVKKGIMRRLSYTKDMEKWQAGLQRIEEGKKTISDEIWQVKTVNIEALTRESFKRKCPVLAEERERLETLARRQEAEKRQKEQEQAAIKQQKEQEASQQKEKPAQPKPTIKSSWEVRKEKKLKQQKFYADVLRRQNKKEIAKYPGLAKIQKDSERLAERTERSLDEIIKDRSRQIEKGYRKVSQQRSRGR